MPDAIEPGGERGYPRDVESRLRVLEEIERPSLRSEFASLRSEMNAGFGSVHAALAAFDQHSRRDVRILFGTIITTTLGLAWLIARSAHWL